MRCRRRELADALGDEALHFGMGEALVELRGSILTTPRPSRLLRESSAASSSRIQAVAWPFLSEPSRPGYLLFAVLAIQFTTALGLQPSPSEDLASTASLMSWRRVMLP